MKQFVTGLAVLMVATAGAPVAHAQEAPAKTAVPTPDAAPVQLTATQILEKSRQTYAGFSSYKGTCSVVRDIVLAVGDAEPTQEVSSALAKIEFTRRERLAIEGVDSGGAPFKALWTPGKAYIERVKRGETAGAAGEVTRRDYEDKLPDLERALVYPAVDGMIAGLTGMTGATASLVPSALQDNDWSNPFPVPDSQLRLLPARNLGIVPCYVIQSTAPELNSVTTYWIEQKTFLLRRITEEMGEQRYDDVPNFKGKPRPIMRVAYSLNQYVFATTEAR